jgi:hypothetical protein
VIVWTGNPHTVETAPAWEGAELRAWRWTIEVNPWSLRLQEQVQHGDAPWRPSHSLGYYMAGVSTKPEAWHVAMHHDYYDGPHHALWIGPLWLNWSGDWCDVCMPPDEEDTSGAVESFTEQLLTAAMADGGGA